MSDSLARIESAATRSVERVGSLMGLPRDLAPRQVEILQSLETIFLRDGFRSVTMGELAAELSCSLRTLYRIAPTKEELFLLVLNRMWARVGDRARRLMVDTADPADRIEIFMREGAREFRPPWDAFIRDVEAYGPAKRLFADHLAIGTEFLAEVVAAGVREGRFRPVEPRLVAKALEVLAYQVTNQDFLDQVGMDALQAEAQLARIVLEGILDDKGAGTR
jgi:AcrR family transcriptional regulator